MRKNELKHRKLALNEKQLDYEMKNLDYEIRKLELENQKVALGHSAHPFDVSRHIRMVSPFSKSCVAEIVATYLNEQKVVKLSKDAVLADEFVLTHKAVFVINRVVILRTESLVLRVVLQSLVLQCPVLFSSLH